MKVGTANPSLESNQIWSDLNWLENIEELTVKNVKGKHGQSGLYWTGNWTFDLCHGDTVCCSGSIVSQKANFSEFTLVLNSPEGDELMRIAQPAVPIFGKGEATTSLGSHEIGRITTQSSCSGEKILFSPSISNVAGLGMKGQACCATKQCRYLCCAFCCFFPTLGIASCVALNLMSKATVLHHVFSDPDGSRIGVVVFHPKSDSGRKISAEMYNFSQAQRVSMLALLLHKSATIISTPPASNGQGSAGLSN